MNYSIQCQAESDGWIINKELTISLSVLTAIFQV